MKTFALIPCVLFMTFTLSTVYATSSNCQLSDTFDIGSPIFEPPMFVYKLSAETNNTISRERLRNAKTVSDLFPDFAMQENIINKRYVLKDVKIRLNDDEAVTHTLSSEIKDENTFTQAQVELLNAADYASIFCLEGYVSSPKDLNDKRYFNYKMAVVPETEASYTAGNDAFIEFLSANCQSTIDKVQKGNLKSGNISFTINKEGAVSDVTLNATCGYKSVDDKMIDLIKSQSGSWSSATTQDGRNVSQTLIFSYGQSGC
ncbi:MAG: hypothetical protein HKO66_01590 [Saprospiraceae bacterium]|nr:hypothetical protein [Bacteroidia bacterium]NNL90902.1 hypothetical protein [Saprospiraceae bacterium]